MGNIYHVCRVRLLLKLNFLLVVLSLLVSFSANAQNSEISVRRGTIDVPTGSTYTFQDRNINTVSPYVTYTILNSGSEDLIISNILIGGANVDQFKLDKSQTAATVAPGTSTTFKIAFAPTSITPEEKNAVVTINSNDADEGEYTLNFTGKAAIFAPTINSNGISPTSGAVGVAVAINGTNLINTDTVYFAGANATRVPATRFVINSDTRITAYVPADAVSGVIAVKNKVGIAVSSQSFTVTPGISSISPTAGAFGATVTINGTNLQDVTSVKFNGTEAVITSNTGTQIVAKVPEGATTGRITVTSPSGSGTSSPIFTVYQPPTITSISAPNGTTSGRIGEVITIKGTNFTSAATVKFFNDITATKTFVSSTELRAVVPTGAATGPITVTTVGGTATSSEFTFINTTYTWNVPSGNWSDPNSWTPVRDNPTPYDILIFNGSNTVSTATIAVAADVPASQNTIGQLQIINKALVTFTVADDRSLFIDNNIPGTDLLVAAGSSLNVTNSAEGADFLIDVTPGETGSVSGTIIFQGTGLAAHKLLARTNAAGGSNLIFQNGGRFIAGSNFSGSPFGTTNINSVSFAAYSTYRHLSGGSPFGAASPNSVVVFNINSTYSHEAVSAPDLIGRSYGNLTINNTGFNQTVAGSGDLRLNTFTQTNAVAFNLNLIGTITISGNIIINKGSLSISPTSASTVKMNGVGGRSISGVGAFTLGTNATLEVEPKTILTLSKNIAGTGQVVVNGTVRVNNPNGFSGGTSTALASSIRRTLHPGSVIEYFGTGAQTISADNYANLTVTGNRNNKIIDLPTSILKVSEVFSITAINVNFNTTGNTIEFNGNGQIIPPFNYNNVIISNGGDKLLNNNITIAGNLDLAAGKIITNSNKLILGESATITESNGNYVVGNLEVVRDLSSTGSDFGGIGISIGQGPLGSQNLGSVTVLRKSGQAGAVNANNNTGINRNWQVLPGIQPTKPIDVTLSWVADDDNGKDLSSMRVWKTRGEDISTFYDVSGEDQDASDHTITASVSSFSILTVSDNVSPLPVELTSFAVTKKNHSAVLNWQTATETNNSGFAVEISTDAKTFKEVGFVKSLNSNSSTPSNYEFAHTYLGSGTVYYRLKQTDWNGKYKYYGPKAIRFDQVVTGMLVYPNPVTEANKEVTVVINGTINEKVTIIVTDALGKAIYRRTEDIIPAQNELKVNLQAQPAGVYLINVTTHVGTTQTKILKQ